MLLYFNKETLELNVQLGALENYTPTPEIKEIVKRSSILRTKKDHFLKTEFDPEIKELLDLIDRINVTTNPELKSFREKQRKAPGGP